MGLRTDVERSYNRKHYENNKDQYAERNRRLRAEKQEFCRKAKAQPCLDCGVQYPYYVMHFDHVRGEKKFNLGQAPSQNKGWQAIKNEIAKCDVVCANCHHIRTWERASLA